MGKFKDALGSGKFVVTAEVGPPKGTDIEEMIEHINLIKDKVDGINSTDNQSSVMRMSSLAVSARLVQQGLEPVYQMVCRDRNRLALQADLLGAYALGIENVLALTGDHVVLGDHPGAKPVFDLDSVQLLATIEALNGGKDLAGNELQGAPDFFAGAVVNPGVEPLGPHILKMRLKVKMGAKFFQTQAVYDPDAFLKFVREVEDLKVPVLVGIIPLKSARMARFMNENIAGINVPEGVIAEMERAKTKEERKEVSAEICARIIRAVEPYLSLIHI